MIGKICEEYTTYSHKDENVIGDGGFGKVYKLNDNYAVKEESKVRTYVHICIYTHAHACIHVYQDSYVYFIVVATSDILKFKFVSRDNKYEQ